MAHLTARNERGAVFLEFAVVLPLLLSLVLGIFTGGMAYTSKVGVVEAVREGARRRAWAGRRRPSFPSSLNPAVLLKGGSGRGGVRPRRRPPRPRRSRQRRRG